MKRFNLILVIVILSLPFSDLHSASEHFPTKSEISPKFWLYVNYFKGSEGYTQLEIYYSVPSSELTFANSDNDNIASITISFKVTNSIDEVVFSNSKKSKLRVKSFRDTKDKNNGLLDQMIIDLLPGNYNLDVSVIDENSNNESKLSGLLVVPFFDTSLDISTIQFASRISQVNNTKSFVKGNKIVIPNPSRKYIYNSSLLYCYYEIYNLVISDSTNKSVFQPSFLVNNAYGDSIIYVQGQSIAFSGTSCIQTKTLDIRDLEPGKYSLSIFVTDAVTGHSVLEKSNFTIHNPLTIEESLPMTEKDIEKYRDQIKYFASYNELELYDKLNTVGKRNFLINFWRAKDTSPKTPTNEFMLNCFARIDYATKNFQNGLNSDMGRVFIIYGQPDEIENRMMNMDAKPYVIWNYFATRTGKHQFVFVDRNGNQNYTLVHSTVETEIYNPNWMQEELQQ